MKKADYIFETSWEICNKVGGIYTVLSTKALTIVNEYKNNYICIGPDLSKDVGTNDDFEEDTALYRNWRETAISEGLRIRVGHWKVAGSPVVILVDFTPYFEKKNEILTDLWLRYKLDSISGQWDYVPVRFRSSGSHRCRPGTCPGTGCSLRHLPHHHKARPACCGSW